MTALSNFAAAIGKQQRAVAIANMQAAQAPKPVALVLHTLVYTCSNCGTAWPAPQVTLKVRYDKGPDSAIGTALLRREAGIYLNLPREHRRIEIAACFCERCFDAESETELTTIRTQLPVTTLDTNGPKPALVPSKQVQETAREVSLTPDVARSVQPRHSHFPPLQKCLGDSRNKCGIMHVCRDRGCQLIQQRFAGAGP